ncbi:ArsR/SmtB family transcription factor [Clostridium nigeriense]|uniref:ArsR/SmtB family transcription factor n=1 Tax=Clostridium nigeriense TaxID=1805470 RepID=UPI003D32FAC3
MGENKLESCNCTIIHKDVVERVKGNLPKEENLYDLADLFKAFSDSTRIKILHALFQEELCVCDLAALLDMTQSAISHQLRVLKGNRLVKFRRDGKVIYYSLADDHIKHIFDEGFKHILE